MEYENLIGRLHTAMDALEAVIDDPKSTDMQVEEALEALDCINNILNDSTGKALKKSLLPETTQKLEKVSKRLKEDIVPSSDSRSYSQKYGNGAEMDDDELDSFIPAKIRGLFESIRTSNKDSLKG